MHLIGPEMTKLDVTSIDNVQSTWPGDEKLTLRLLLLAGT